MSRSSPVTESLRAELSHAICRPNDTKGVVTLSKQLDAVVAIFERFALAQTPAVLEALTLAEDVLSRRPFSSGIWPNGMHPQEGIEKIRAALAMAQALEVTDEMLERATAAFYEQQEGPINFTAGMRAAITAALSVSSTVRTCDHDWKIWPETDGHSQRCMKCGAYRDTPTSSPERK